jgi:micrococcal nuclease
MKRPLKPSSRVGVLELVLDMTTPKLIRVLFLLALPLAVFSSGSAASLQGKVTEVADGDSFTIVSQKLPVKIRLIAIAVPASEQSYASAARQHLTELILNKYVVVRYSALQGGFLIGQVLLGDMDVGAQMIRDGVAWYNKTDERLLSDGERQVYSQSQDLARSERRGLWQDESPVAPWDFQKARLAKPNARVSSLPTLSRPASSPGKTKPRGLSNEDLMGGVIQPGTIAGKPEVRPISGDASPGHWLTYQPANRHFSIFVPSTAVQVTYPVLDEEGQILDIHYVVGNSEGNLYFVMWTKGPNGTSTDASAAADAIKGMLAGLNRTTERTGIVVTAAAGRNLKLSGYGGRRYVLTAGPASGEVRVYSNQLDDNREIFMLCVLNRPGNESSETEFFNSFKIR